MAGITENESRLIAIFIQSCLWGVFAVMFTLTCWTLICGRPQGRSLNVPMLFVAIFMFVLATMQLGVYFTQVIRQFIVHEGRIEDYNQLAEVTSVFGSALYVLQTFVGDGVALYRCYVVWNRRFVFIILPGLIYIGSIVAGIGALVKAGRANADDLVFAQTVKLWITSLFSLTLATSTICTIMIASRIWYLSNQSIRHGGGTRSHLHPVALVILESGAIYSSLLIALIILYVQESWFQYVIVDSLACVIGIVFSVIIVRIGLGIAVDPDTIHGTMDVKSIGGSDTHAAELNICQTHNRLPTPDVEKEVYCGHV